MRYVWFNGIDGREVAVNPQNVLWVREAHNAAGNTYIAFGKDTGLTVKESPRSVTGLIESAMQ